MSSIRNRIRSAGAIFAGEMAAAAAGFVFTLVAAAQLGTRAFGVYGIAAAAVATYGVVFDVRLEDVAGRRFRALEGSTDRDPVWSSYLWADVAFGVVRLALVTVLLPLVGAVYGDDTLVPTLVLAAALAVGTPDSTIAVALVVAERRVAVAVGRAVGPLVRLVVLMTVHPTDARALSTVFLAGSVTSTLVLLTAARRHLKGPRSLRRFRREWSQGLNTIAHLSGSSALRGVAANADQLLLGALIGPSSVAIYRVAKTVANVPVLAIGALRLTELPRIYASAVEGDEHRLRSSLYGLSVVCAGITLVAMVGWGAVGRLVVVAVLGSEYTEVYAIAAILLVATLAEYVTSWSKFLPAALGRGALATREAVLYAVAPLALMPPAILAWGLVGAAVSTVAAPVIASAAWFHYVRADMPRDLRRLASRDGGQAAPA